MNLYEYRPTICVVVGLWLGLAFDGSLGRWSAALLILAGVIIFNRRIAYRSSK